MCHKSGALSQDQRDLLCTYHYEKIPAAAHRTHRRDSAHRQFCAIFSPTLKSMLPVSQEEADAILTHMVENLPYTMRPPVRRRTLHSVTSSVTNKTIGVHRPE
jgi:hypothetical protein